jgi:hypothetical protein
VFKLSDKYDVHGLSQPAREKFQRACGQYWDTVELEEVVAYVHEVTDLMDVIAKMIVDHMSLREREVHKRLLKDERCIVYEVLMCKRILMEVIKDPTSRLRKSKWRQMGDFPEHSTE